MVFNLEHISTNVKFFWNNNFKCCMVIYLCVSLHTSQTCPEILKLLGRKLTIAYANTYTNHLIHTLYQ